MRTSLRAAIPAVVALALVAGCSDDGDDPAESGTTVPTTESTTTTTAPDDETTTSTSTTVAAPEDDPVAAAQEFLDQVFPANTATLGEFAQGDARSGEIEVLRPAEGGGTANVASTLLLRLDENDEWEVIGAVQPAITIESPENAATIPPGRTAVSGVGRGFEGTLVARAFADDGTQVAEAIGAGGSQAESLPYEVFLDLSGVETGTEVVIVVAGGTGLEGDPGEFAAIRVTVG